MEIKIPSQVEAVIEQLKTCGQEAYIVGGCVRDSILGLTPMTGMSQHPRGQRKSVLLSALAG